MLRIVAAAGSISTAGCSSLGRTTTETPGYPNTLEGVVRGYYTDRDRDEILEYVHPESEFREIRAEYQEQSSQNRLPREIEELQVENETSDRAVVRVTYRDAGRCEDTRRPNDCTTYTQEATLRTNETGAWKIWSEASLDD
jgi:hypothetical protein